MRCRLAKREGARVEIELVFSAEEFAERVIASFRSFTSKREREKALLLTLDEAVNRSPMRVRMMQDAIHELYLGNRASIEDELGLFFGGEPILHPIQGDIGEDVCVLCEAQVMNPVDELGLDEIEVEYRELYLDGTEVDRKLAFMKRYYNTEAHSNLAQHIPGCTNGGSVRKMLKSYFDAYVKRHNAIAKRQAVISALVEISPFDASDAEIDVLVAREIDKMRLQLGERQFTTQFAKGSQSLAELERMIRNDVSNDPVVDKTLSAIARQIDVDVTDEKRIAAIEVQRLQMPNPGSIEPAVKTLEHAKQDPDAMALLDEVIARDEAFEYVASKVQSRAGKSVALFEGAPQVINSVDLKL